MGRRADQSCNPAWRSTCSRTGARRRAMKTAVLCGLAIVCSSAAFAQTPAAAAAPDSTRTVTMTGCVAGGQDAQPITLANAMIVPTAQTGAATPSPVPGTASSGATQPAGASGGVGAPPPAGATSAGVGTPGAAGTSGTAGTAGVTGTAGVSGTAAPAAGVGASASIAGTAPAGSSGSSITGYRLSGTDMTSWIGRRVQIVGAIVPPAPGASPTAAAGARNASAFPEFRVVSVEPITGDCPQK